MCLANAMVGILAENHHFYVLKGCFFKGMKQLLWWWKDLAKGIFISHKVSQPFEIVFGKFFL